VKIPTNKRVSHVSPDQPLTAAFEAMKGRKCRHLPVLDGGHLVGILSDRDILPFTDAHAGGTRVKANVSVGKAMTRFVYTCREDDGIEAVIDLMLKSKVDAVPIVDASGRFAGMVTSTDVIKLFRKELRRDSRELQGPKIRSLMRRDDSCASHKVN
jgi:acetoin utilization protein AcuB